MTVLTAEEWGRVAVSLPGWRWMPGMLDQKNRRYHVTVPHELCNAVWPDPDDPATAGCLLALLGSWVTVTRSRSGGYIVHVAGHEVPVFGEGPSIGRAAIAAAAKNGRWPGGEE